MPSVATNFTTFGTQARAGSIGGSESWGTPANAQTDDDSRASYGTNMVRPWSGYTFYLTAKQVAEAVPAGATIEGIRATVVRRKTSNGVGTWQDSAVLLIKGGTVQTAQNKASATAYTTTDAAQQYGGPTDLWGLAWTADDVNGAGFGIAVSCATSGMDQEDSDTAEVDSVTVEVFYSLASSPRGLMLSGTGD
jgi:hypothetical protein